MSKFLNKLEKIVNKIQWFIYKSSDILSFIIIFICIIYLIYISLK